MFVEAKEFSNISFDAISKNGRSDLLFYYNTQSMKWISIFLNEEDEVFRSHPPPYSHHPSEILRMVDPLSLGKAKRSLHLNG